MLEHLGPDLCEPDVDIEAVVTRLATLDPGTELAAALLDQRVRGRGGQRVQVGGLLGTAHLSVHPDRPDRRSRTATGLRDPARRQLTSNLHTARRTTYRNGLAVYRRAGQRCPVCGAVIKTRSGPDHAIDLLVPGVPARADRRLLIFVRHGRALVQPDVPTHDWPLDPAHLGAIEELHAVMPALPVVCSDMRRAVDTAAFFGEPKIDERLREVERPWSDDLHGPLARYLRSEVVPGWEPQADAAARVRAVAGEHGRAIYVTHGTVLSLYVASIVRVIDAMQFWTDLTNPDAWELADGRLSLLTPRS